MARARVVLNHAGARELLGSAGVRRAVEQVAARVASTAGGGAKVEQATTGGYRAVVRVVDDEPGALYREASTGRLVRALGGGR